MNVYSTVRKPNHTPPLRPPLMIRKIHHKTSPTVQYPIRPHMHRTHHTIVPVPHGRYRPRQNECQRTSTIRHHRFRHRYRRRWNDLRGSSLRNDPGGTCTALTTPSYPYLMVHTGRVRTSVGSPPPHGTTVSSTGTAVIGTPSAIRLCRAIMEEVDCKLVNRGRVWRLVNELTTVLSGNAPIYTQFFHNRRNMISWVMRDKGYSFKASTRPRNSWERHSKHHMLMVYV